MASTVDVAAARLGKQLAATRKLHRLTSHQIAERANISRTTLSRLENGHAGISLGVVLAVAQALGALDVLVDSIDPYQTDLGRARAQQRLPQRVRQ